MAITRFHKWLALLLAAFLLGAAPVAHAQEEALNILIIGVDASAEGERGRSDTMLLLRVDPAAQRIRMASFLRDLYVSIPGVGQTRLNAAYYHGGEELLKRTLEKAFQVTVDRTVTVRFSHLADLVDQLGGIEVEIEERELHHLNRLIRDANADYDELKASGTQTLDGRQALSYSRIRKIDSDFQRTSRQQKVVSAILQKLSTLGKWQLLRLAAQNLGRVETDVSFGDIRILAPLLGQLADFDVRTAHVPFDGAYTEETRRGMQVLVPDLSVCRRRLSSFLQDH